MSYMLGSVRSRKATDMIDIVRRRKVIDNIDAKPKPREEPPYRPVVEEAPVITEQIEPEPEPEEVEPQQTGPGLVHNIFIKIKRDRLTKFLIALLLGILLLLLFLAVFGSQFNTAPNVPRPNPPISAPIPAAIPVNTQPSNPIPRQVIIDDTTLSVRLAITNDEQTRGLRFTPTLTSNEGMLYIFSQPDRYPFWAKDMQYPMDIIFISSGNRVNDIIENMQPCAQSCPIYEPPSPILYAIEVNGGWVDDNLIDIGDPVVFQY